MKVKVLENSFGQVMALVALAVASALPVQASAAVPEAPILTSIDNTPVSPPTSPPPSSGDTGVPLSFNDAAFANVTNSGKLSLSASQTKSNLSIVESSGDPSITCNGSCSLTNVRIQSREGIRCQSGTINLTWMWIEVAGTGSDHADGLQCYAPNSTGTVNVRNTTFKGTNANAGYFSADNWKGAHTFENVLFQGGNYGLRIPADGGSSVKLKNVYFVKDSFLYGAFLFDSIGGKTIPITQWENVYWVTIQNGKMVLGAPIPKPN